MDDSQTDRQRGASMDNSQTDKPRGHTHTRSNSVDKILASIGKQEEDSAAVAARKAKLLMKTRERSDSLTRILSSVAGEELKDLAASAKVSPEKTKAAETIAAAKAAAVLAAKVAHDEEEARTTKDSVEKIMEAVASPKKEEGPSAATRKAELLLTSRPRSESLTRILDSLAHPSEPPSNPAPREEDVSKILASIGISKKPTQDDSDSD
eukprot:g80634.t1